eukprot:403339071
MLRGMFGNSGANQDDTYESVSPRKPTNLDQVLSRNDYNNNDYEDYHETQPYTEFQDSELIQQKDFEAIMNGKDLIVDNLRSQNQILKEQLVDLNYQLDELGNKLRLYEQKRKTELELRKCDHEPVIMQLESVLKIKDKEYTNLLNIQQQTLNQKDKELQSHHSHLKQIRAQIEKSKTKKLFNHAQAVGFEKINELESKLKLVEKKHAELSSEQAALKRIQGEQSKALEEVGDTKNYPGKIRLLLSEMRELRDKNKLLEERFRGYEDNKKKSHQRMLILEDRCKELKMKINAAEGKVLGVEGQEGYFANYPQDSNSNKVSPNKKREMDENKQNLIKKIQALEHQINDKESQNRQYALKIREIQQQQVRGWAEYQEL